MAVTFTFVNLAWAAIFVGIVVCISLAKDYRIVREHLSSVGKMLVQLFAMGFVPVGIIYVGQYVNFAISMALAWSVISVMLLNAVITTSSRGKGIPHIYAITATGILTGSFLVIIIL